MYTYKNPVEVVSGTDVLKNLGKIMKEHNLDKAILVADPFSAKTGVADQVKEYADGRIIAIVSDVEPNPTCDNVDACAKVAREVGACAVVALGGGSAMDCAKSTAAAVALSCTGMDLLKGKAITDALPVIAIPTTAGTGSEVGRGAVLSNHDTNEKIAIFGNILFPKVALIDPVLTYTVPAQITASTGLDVIAHSLDAMCSVKHNPVSDALAVYAAKLAFENIEAVYEDGNNEIARANMCVASNTAGYAFSNTGTTASHACSYLLTAKYRVPHGEACAFTLDVWFKNAAKVRPELENLAKMMGFDSVDAVCKKINELKQKTKMRMTLTEMNVPDTEEAIEELTESAAASGNMINDIGHPSKETIKAVFISKK